MKILCVDDEPIVLEEVQGLLQKQPEVSQAVGFLSAAAALQWAESHLPEAAFLDINLGAIDGLTLAKRLRELCPDCAIVFVTGYSQYAVSAFELHVEGYLMKPATEEDVRRELEHLLHRRPLTAPQSKHSIRVQCFGNFEVFVGTTPLHFDRNKTKELMAYLVDRQGAACTMGELIAVLWEDAPDSPSMRSNLRNLIHDLKSTLVKANAEEILVKDRNTLALNCGLFDCDFYDFLRRMPYAVNCYRGEYMRQYSWAELTLPSLR